MQITEMLYTIFVVLGLGLLVGALIGHPQSLLADGHANTCTAHRGQSSAGQGLLHQRRSHPRRLEGLPLHIHLEHLRASLSTHDQLIAQADVHNKEVRIERLNRILMLLSSALQQVGTLSGELESEVEAVYPDQATIA